MKGKSVMRIGIVGRVNSGSLDTKSHFILLDILADLIYTGLQTVVTDANDGGETPGADWAEKRGYAVRPFAEPMPPETLGYWARRRAMKARCRRFVEQCDCVYLIDKRGARARMIEKCCRRRGIWCSTN